MVKMLYDGTEVPDSVPTKATGKGRVPLTPKEAAARKAEETANAAERARYEAEEAYKDRRRAEYPTIGDQLDAIWHDLANIRADGTPLSPEADVMLQEIEEIKARHPKP